MGGGKPLHEGWLTKSPPQTGSGLKVRVLHCQLRLSHFALVAVEVFFPPFRHSATATLPDLIGCVAGIFRPPIFSFV